MKLSPTPTIVIALLLILSSTIQAQNKKDSLGLPGDNFDLYAALELFKQSKNPEAFEKAINSNDNEVNNLDLDADGKVDYVKVIDKNTDKLHALVLQVAVSKTETQDVAVIEIEKTGSDNAHVQIVGDEELYGKNYIIEPKETSSKSAIAKNDVTTDDVYSTGGNNSSNNKSDNNNSTNYSDAGSQPVVINVWGWPSVQYVYGPAYVGWNSPYYWGYYPGWWQPWQPVYYPVYYRRVYRYHHPYYYRTSYYRCNNAHDYYYGRRMSSETVRQRNNSGYYRNQQDSYRNNPVQGRRYNSLPANGNKTTNRTENRARENNVRSNSQNTNRGNGQNRATQAQSRNSQGTRSTERSSGRSNEIRSNQNSAPRSTERRSTQTNQQSRGSQGQQNSGGSRAGGGGNSAPRGQQSQGGGSRGSGR